MDRHNNRVLELVRNPDLGLSDVYSRVLVGLLARQPIEVDLFPGIHRGLLARNPQVGSASLLTRRMRVSSLYPTTGQMPMVLVPPLGGRSLPLAGNGVGRADHPMRRL